MMRPIYTGIFFENRLHMTWHFDSLNTPLFPDNIKEGTSTVVEVVGEYEDEEVACLIVRWQDVVYNPQNVYLHITTKALIEPQYSGIRATKNGWKVIKTSYFLHGIWQYGAIETENDHQ